MLSYSESGNEGGGGAQVKEFDCPLFFDVQHYFAIHGERWVAPLMFAMFLSVIFNFRSDDGDIMPVNVLYLECCIYCFPIDQVHSADIIK